MTRLRIRWKKSTIGYSQRQRDTVRSLGLRRLNAEVEHEDSPTLRGMLLAVRHLVEVTDLSKGEPRARPKPPILKVNTRGWRPAPPAEVTEPAVQPTEPAQAAAPAVGDVEPLDGTAADAQEGDAP